MKNGNKILLLTVALFFGFFSLSFGLTFADVGGFDTFHSGGVVAPSDELSWIEGQLGMTVGSLNKWDHDTDPQQWMMTSDDPDAIYLDFEGEQPYAFLIKGGSDQNPSLSYDGDGLYSVLLFINEDNKDFGVLNLSLLDKDPGSFSIETISHTAFSGAAPVPEPSTLLLLGAGLVGFAVYRRQRK